MTCRKRINESKTEMESLSWDESGRNLSTGQMLSGIEVARTRFRLSCGTCERVGSTLSLRRQRREGEAQVAETTRARVPMRPTRTDQRVVAMKAL